MTKTANQPFANFTVYQTEKGRFVIAQNNGNNRASGETFEAANRMAHAHFGMLIQHKGFFLGQ